MTDNEVRWTPYTAEAIAARAPHGLSSLCFRDQWYWMTRTPLVYDVQVEEYHVRRVMRQFGLYQESPLPVVHTVSPSTHRYVIAGSLFIPVGYMRYR
jgi:hypothetical protein